jgi:hypothetical protein
MASTVVALYDDFGSANAAVRDLVDNGFPRNDISLVASDINGQYSSSLANPNATTSNTEEGASVGAGIGAVVGGLGGLLVGLGALAIPGVGPVIAAGPLAAAISALAGAGVGAVAGGVSGGLIGALMDMGVPRETAEYYSEGIRRGGHLVTISTGDDMTNRAVEILNRHDPVDINRRAQEWRQGGWTGYNPNAGAYTPVTSEQPRDWPRSADVQPQVSSTSEESSVNRVDQSTGAGVTGAMGQDAQSQWSGTLTPANESRPARDYNDFSYYDAVFRDHFQNGTYASQNSYDQFRPAYQYGYRLATDQSYQGKSWNEVEPEARQRWDEQNPGTWDQFKDSVYYAWQEIKDSVS